jgi:hypothetical protein
MISSLNAYSGLSSPLVLKLFDTASASSSGAVSATEHGAPNDPTSVRADPASAIKAILADSQIVSATGGGGWSITEAAEAAYASQMSGGAIGVSVTTSSPGTEQQINDAVSLINQTQIMRQTELDPSKNNGALLLDSPIVVSAKNAVVITISGGTLSAAAEDDATFPDGLPSLARVQQVLAGLKSEDEAIGFNGQEATPVTNAKETADNWWNNTFDGSLTLVQLPPGTLGASGGTFTTFTDGGANWALVISQKTTTVAAEATQNNS